MARTEGGPLMDDEVAVVMTRGPAEAWNDVATEER
mgnify:CR=1 FL=1